MKADFSALLKGLTDAGRAGLPAAKYGLYETARLVAQAMHDEAGRLPYKPSTVSQIQNAMGIATFRDGLDVTDTSISFEGYFAESGFPVQFFVRRVEKGSSKFPAHPFQRTALNRVQAQAEAAGEKAAEQFAQRMLDQIKDK